MNKLKKILTIVVLLMSILLLFTKGVFAISVESAEYTEEYKNWLKLSDEEKSKVLMPRMYNVQLSNKTSNNILYKARLLGASLNSRFSLRDVIPEQIVIKDQKQTQSCWAFASLSSLETNLALANHQNGLASKYYDFSERHMEYGCSRFFANDKENPLGYNRMPGSSGQWYYAESYLTNGLGAIEESEMPFEDNEELIDISEIQNKTVSSQVYDTIDFPNYRLYTGAERTQIMNDIKQHIQNYGSVFSAIHLNFFNQDIVCYNNDTGAQYCNNPSIHQMNHGISIIGWDDNYSVENFCEESRPSSNGAWIVRDSHGERLEYPVIDFKNAIFEAHKEKCIENGWDSPEKIPDELIEEIGYSVEGDIAYMSVGDNGIMYVSYDDCVISQSMNGIIKATDTVDYDYLYQYDEFYPGNYLVLNNSKIMVCNVFDKKSTGPEYLTQVALYAPETYTCKVYVNPNGTSKASSDMQFVELKAGDSETIGAGYHTLEFAKPVEIKGNKFTVAVQIQSTSGTKALLCVESKVDGSAVFDSVKVETGKCFVTTTHNFDECEWADLGRFTEEGADVDGDSTLKAFTVSELIDESLKSIEIVTPPTKTHYFEGENFDKTGMVVKAYYRSRKNPSVILDEGSYSISNGNNLQVNQTSVTITFEDQSVEQAITVEKNSVTELTIKTPPTKTEYKEGQNFDKTGMIVEATYKNGTTKEVTDYTIDNGNNVKENQTQVTISYDGKSVNQSITVTPNKLIEINVTKAPNKTKYVAGQNFDKTGMVVTGKYQDESTVEIKDYTIENGTKLVKDQKSVTIKYEDKATEQSITVEEKAVTEITINKLPTKTQYYKNKEDLDVSGGSITVSYNDGTKEVVALDSELVTVSGFDNSNAGKNTITVKYGTKTTTFNVDIVIEPQPLNSNLDNINCAISNVKYCKYTDPNKQEYMLMDVVVDNIVRMVKNGRSDVNDSYEYYYYLSTDKDIESIENWVKVPNDGISDDKIEFTLDTRKVGNYNDLSNMNNLYLFIKEVAIKGGNQSVLVSKAMTLDSDASIETYLDDVNVTAKDSSNNDNNTSSTTTDNNNNNSNNNTKQTTATGVLPYTGAGSLLVVISIITVAGIVFFIRYKNLKVR